MRVAVAATALIFSPGDRPPPRRLYVVERGSAMYKSATVGPSQSWGDDVLLRNDVMLRRCAHVFTFLHCQSIGTDELFALQPDFPHDFARARAHAIFVACCEHVIRLKRETDSEEMRRRLKRTFDVAYVSVELRAPSIAPQEAASSAPGTSAPGTDSLEDMMRRMMLEMTTRLDRLEARLPDPRSSMRAAPLPPPPIPAFLCVGPTNVVVVPNARRG